MSAVLWFIIAVLAFMLAFGVFAFYMYDYRVVIMSKKIDIPPPKSALAKKNAAKSSKHGKNAVLHLDPSSSAKVVCNSVFISFSPLSTKSTEIVAVPSAASAAKSLPKKEKTEFDRKLERWHQNNISEIAVNPDAEKKKRIFPPWDEVEMRRHGLVNRHCDRVYGPNYPSDPSSIDVSVYNPYSSGDSQGSIQCTFPPDSASAYSKIFSFPRGTSASHSQQKSDHSATIYSNHFSRPLASSTPRSQPLSIAAAPSSGNAQQDARVGNAALPSQSHLSSVYMFDQGAKDNDAAAKQFPQSSSVHTGVALQNQSVQHHPEHQVAQNANAAPSPQSRLSSAYMLDQGAKDDAAAAKQFPQSSSIHTGVASSPAGLLNPSGQHPPPNAPTQASPSQISLPSQASVYAEPNLHNSPFAYQKNKTLSNHVL